MTRTSSAVFVVLLLLVSLESAMAQEVSRENEVRAAVSAFGRAFVEADVSILRTFLTDRYIHLNGRSGSVLSRDEWLKWVESRRADLNNGKLVLSAYWVEDLKVELYGEAAVVTGVVYSSGNQKGIAFTSQLRFTNVWVIQGGAWRRAAFHDSPMPEPGA